MVDIDNYKAIKKELGEEITLVAVSKTKPIEDIQELYNLGHRDFGENYVQELVDKEGQLPKDIRWHFIGHLQRNKAKLIAPFVQLIHGVDSLTLLKEINKQGEKSGRVVNCLLQVHIAEEETKFGLDKDEVGLIRKEWEGSEMNNVQICGLMGMASFTDDRGKLRAEFQQLKKIFDTLRASGPGLQTLSMGMSSDYTVAVEEGSNMVRIGSLIFGERKRNE